MSLGCVPKGIQLAKEQVKKRLGQSGPKPKKKISLISKVQRNVVWLTLVIILVTNLVQTGFLFFSLRQAETAKAQTYVNSRKNIFLSKIRNFLRQQKLFSEDSNVINGIFKSSDRIILTEMIREMQAADNIERVYVFSNFDGELFYGKKVPRYINDIRNATQAARRQMVFVRKNLRTLFVATPIYDLEDPEGVIVAEVNLYEALRTEFSSVRQEIAINIMYPENQSGIVPIADVKDLVTSKSPFIAYKLRQDTVLNVLAKSSMGFIVAIFLAIFIAFVLGRSLGERIVRPISNLIERVKTGRPATSLSHDESKSNFSEIDYLAHELDKRNEQLTALNESLEEKVKMRTKELFGARKEALRAAKAKTEFLSIMSHEIRTPLNSVIGMTELLGETHLTSEQQTYLETLSRTSDTLLSLINDILDYAKINSGEIKLEKQVFDLETLIAESCMMATARAREKNLQIYLEYSADCRTLCHTDPLRIQQVMLNLLSNAVKFTSEGYVKVSVSFGGGVEDLVIEVQDTGIGIPKEKQQTVFTPFQQAEISTTRKFGGTGLGLSIVDRLVEIMGGEIQLDSEVGVGTTFRVRLPAEILHGEAELPEFAQFHGRRFALVYMEANPLEFKAFAEVARRISCEVDCISRSEFMAFERGDIIGYDAFFVTIQKVENNLDLLHVAEQIGVPARKIVPVLDASHQKEEVKFLRSKEYHHYIVRPVTTAAIVRSLGEQTAPVAGKNTGQEFPALANGEKLNILVAEDSEDNRNLLKLYLKGQNVELTFAENGRIAADLFAEYEFDLVIMDMQMPVMNGYDATKEIRKIEAEEGWPETTVVGLSASVIKTEIDEAYASGCNHYLTKPIRKKVLIDFLHEFVNGSDSQAA